MNKNRAWRYTHKLDTQRISALTGRQECVPDDGSNFSGLFNQTDMTNITQQMIGTTQTYPTSSKGLIAKSSAKFQFLNSSNCPAQVDFYWCQPREDTNSYPWTWAGNYALQQADTGPDGSYLRQYHGITPYMNQAFCEKWKIVTRKSFWLKPNQVKKLYFSKVNTSFNYGHFTHSYMANVSFVPLVYIRGKLVGTSDGAADPENRTFGGYITSGEVQVNMCVDRWYKYLSNETLNTAQVGNPRIFLEPGGPPTSAFSTDVSRTYQINWNNVGSGVAGSNNRNQVYTN